MRFYQGESFSMKNFCFSCFMHEHSLISVYRQKALTSHVSLQVRGMGDYIHTRSHAPRGVDSPELFMKCKTPSAMDIWLQININMCKHI